MWIKGKSYKQKVFGFVLLFLTLSVLSAPAGASAYNDWSGVWTTTYGDLTLAWTKQGGLTGTFGKNGQLEGKPADPWAAVIRGTWSDGKDSGSFEFRMDKDMKSFQGWRNSPGTPWRGTRDSVPEPVD